MLCNIFRIRTPYPAYWLGCQVGDQRIGVPFQPQVRDFDHLLSTIEGNRDNILLNVRNDSPMTYCQIQKTWIFEIFSPWIEVAPSVGKLKLGGTLSLLCQMSYGDYIHQLQIFQYKTCLHMTQVLDCDFGISSGTQLQEGNGSYIVIYFDDDDYVKTETIPVITRATETSWRSFRKYLSNIPGKH